MELADGTRDVVDPEVRAYVSSLVTAVSLLHSTSKHNSLTRIVSLEEAAPMRMGDTYLEMMPWRVFEILRGG